MTSDRAHPRHRLAHDHTRHRHTVRSTDPRPHPSDAPPDAPSARGTGPTVRSPSVRHRLLTAFAVLNDHGITARSALGEDPHSTRTALLAAIRQWHPAAAGSYVFWTAADESCFDTAGELRRPLTLFHSGPAVARAVHATLRQAGLLTSDGPDHTLCVHLPPAKALGSRASKR